MAMEANLKLKLKLILPPTLEEKEFLSPLNMLMYFYFFGQVLASTWDSSIYEKIVVIGV